MHTVTIYRALICALAAQACAAHAHKRVIHAEISGSAAVNSDGLKGFLTENLGPSSAPFVAGPLLNWDQTFFLPTANSPVEWVRMGSHHEDDNPRYVNHFYAVAHTPRALTDISALDETVIGASTPVDSFSWVSGAAGGNTGTWQAARGNQYWA